MKYPTRRFSNALARFLVASVSSRVRRLFRRHRWLTNWAAVIVCGLTAGAPARADYLQTYIAAICGTGERGIVLFGYGDADDAPDFPKIAKSLDGGLSRRSVFKANFTKASCRLGDGQQLLVRYRPFYGLGTWSVWLGQIRVAQGDASVWIPAAVIVDRHRYRICRIDLGEDRFTYGIDWPVKCDASDAEISGPPDTIEFPGQFTPTLIADYNPPVCAGAAREIVMLFPLYDDRTGLHPGPGRKNPRPHGATNADRFNWVHWQQDNFHLDHVLVDLDGDGKREYVLRYSFDFYGPYAPHGNRAYVVNAKQLEAAKAEFNNDNDHAEAFIEAIHGGALQNLDYYYPNEKPGDASNSQTEQWHDVFEFQHGYYFYDTDRLDIKPISVFKIHADGHTELQCTIRTIPEQPGDEK